MTGDSQHIASASVAAREETGLLARIGEEFRFFVKLAALLIAILTLIWGHYKIPSESMQPTLEVGDHIYVSKFAYGYSRHSLPLGLHRLPLPDGKLFARLPKRGDIIVFRNPNNGTVMIKRMIGLPGDEIQLVQGRLVINGMVVPRELQGDLLYRAQDTFGTILGASQYVERLPGVAEPHIIYEQSDEAPLDNTDIFVVPQGHVFFMGDNRERSTDSRINRTDPFGRPLSGRDLGPGFVPLDHLIGRADFLMFSFNRCDRTEGLRCPEDGRAPSRL